MTVCALPSSDLQTSPTFVPCADASIAARKPAPPAPITSTSCSNVSISLIDASCCSSCSSRAHHSSPASLSKDPPVVPDTRGAEADINVGEPHADETHPRPLHVPPIQTRRAIVRRLLDWVLRDLIVKSTHDVSERVTAERVTRQQHDVQCKQERPDT